MFLAFLSQFKISNQENFSVDSFTYIHEQDLQKLKKKENTAYVYMPRLAFVDFKRLQKFLKLDFVYAGLSTYWGIGHPYLAIFKDISILKKAVAKISDEQAFEVFDTKTENLLFEVYSSIVKKDSIEDILNLSNEEMLKLNVDNKILCLDDVCHITSEGFQRGLFETSIFKSWNDLSFDYHDFFSLCISNIKEVYYKGNSYECSIGKNFFMSHTNHFAILDKKVILWNGKEWTEASKEEKESIKLFLNKNKTGVKIC